MALVVAAVVDGRGHGAALVAGEPDRPAGGLGGTGQPAPKRRGTGGAAAVRRAWPALRHAELDPSGGRCLGTGVHPSAARPTEKVACLSPLCPFVSVPFVSVPFVSLCVPLCVSPLCPEDTCRSTGGAASVLALSLAVTIGPARS